MRMKDIPPENRPRERLLKYGPENLSDAELLALILEKGTRDENVVDMSNRLISRYGFDNLSCLSLTEIQEIKGIGLAKAMQIKALFELYKRVKGRKVLSTIKSAKDVFAYLQPRLRDLDKEQFVVLHLNSKNKLIREETVSVGILDTALVHPREIFKNAIKESASKIVVVHNHPSGDVSPSENDIKTTRVLFGAGDVLGITVVDHVIIGGEQYYSFREQGKL